MKRLRYVALSAAVLLAACGDERPQPTAPSLREPGTPNATVTDGNNGGGNPDFFFLSPLVKDPVGNANFKDDAFDGTRKATVEICKSTFTLTAANLCDAASLAIRYLPSEVAVSGTDEQYRVNVQTDDSRLPAGKYRIRVLITVSGANIELGHANIDLVDQQQVKNANTGDAIALTDGRTLPLKFRIETNPLVSADDDDTRALQYNEQVIPNDNPNAGGTIMYSSTDPSAAVAGSFFTDGWLAGQGLGSITVVIEERAVTSPALCHPGSDGTVVQSGKCIRYSTIPALQPFSTTSTDQFSQPVIVGFCRELDANLPQYQALRVYRSKSDVPDQPVAIPPVVYTRFFPLPACDGTPSVAVRAGAGAWDRMYAGLQNITNGLARVLGPKLAYAVDLGLGGETREFSDFNFGFVPAVAAADAAQSSGTAGSTVPVRFKVSVRDGHHDPAVSGVPVTLTTATTTLQATSDAQGLVTFPVTLVAQPGPNVATAKILTGIGAQQAAITVNGIAPLTDAVGDATKNDLGTPDLVSTAVGVAGGNALISVRFASGTFSQTLSHVTLSLDTDQNVQTGSPGVDAGGNDRALMGTDAIVSIGSFYNGAAVRLAQSNEVNDFGSLVTGSPFAVTYVADGVDVAIPLAALRETDGFLNFKATSSTRLGATATTFSGVQDYASDLGVAPGTTAPPIVLR